MGKWMKHVVMPIVAVVAAALLCMPAPTAAQPHKVLVFPHSFHMDQDLFAPDNEDRNYTMGLRFVWQDEAAKRHVLGTFGTLERLDGTLGFAYQESDMPNRAVSFGNSAFTPDDLRRSDVIVEDRPYASLLYTGSSVVVQKGDAAEASKLVIGVLGLHISEWVQTRIHVINRSVSGGQTPYDPQGWDNQISDGGELTAMYQRAWMRRIPLDSVHLDAGRSCDVYVGYYTGASCGIVGKIGKFERTRPFWTMFGEIDPQGDANMLRALQDAKNATGATAMHSRQSVDKHWIREAYLLVGGRVRLVGYNELLQGGFRDSRVTFGSGDIERVLFEGSLGFNLTFRSSRRLMFTCSQRSAEHKRAERRAHTWCGINYYQPLQM